MLSITIDATTLWDDQNQCFFDVKAQTLQLEHSLISLSKWESKWCRSFISSDREMTYEEEIDYIRCMTLTPNVDPMVYHAISNAERQKISAYIKAPMTATYLPEDKSAKPSREKITSELLYYWMIALNIPFECQKWHLNKLIALIRVCSAKNQPNKNRSKRDIMASNAALNAANRKRFNSKG